MHIIFFCLSANNQNDGLTFLLKANRQSTWNTNLSVHPKETLITFPASGQYFSSKLPIACHPWVSAPDISQYQPLQDTLVQQQYPTGNRAELDHRKQQQHKGGSRFFFAFFEHKNTSCNFWKCFTRLSNYRTNPRLFRFFYESVEICHHYLSLKHTHLNGFYKRSKEHWL